MYWLALILVFFLGLRLLVATVNMVGSIWFAGRKALSPALSALRENVFSPEQDLVSVLIPARNEEQNIGVVLQDLLNHDYQNLEVLVYDDLSEDLTAEVVRRFEAADRRVRLLPGRLLPAGWLGKNHACHHLAKEARGDYLLFLDADVRIFPGLIGKALSHVKKYQLALLSLFPRQLMVSFSERITVPLMNWVLVSLLPLILTRVSSWSSFSAANGQFMLFDAGVYRQHRFHEMVRSHQVEDILIFRKMKQLGLKVQTLLSDGTVACRMYRSFHEAVQGFSKNVFEFFGGSVLGGMAFGLVTTLGFIPVWVTWGGVAVIAFLAVGLALRAIVAAASRQPLVQNIILAPLQQFMFLWVIMVAVYNRTFGKTKWKGRDVKLA